MTGLLCVAAMQTGYSLTVRLTSKPALLNGWSLCDRLNQRLYWSSAHTGPQMSGASLLHFLQPREKTLCY